MIDFLWLVIAFPLTGAAVLLLFGKRFGDPWAGWVASGTVFASFLFALPLIIPLIQGTEEAQTVFIYEWIPIVHADISILWDPLSALMTLLVTGIGTVIHVYSIGYMRGDGRFGRYFAYLNLFAGSMLILVLANNYAMMFIGWELVGFCSYLLISFWFVRPAAAAAGKKAFIVNRIGDFGYIVAMMLIFFVFGTFDFDIVFGSAASELSHGMAVAITLLLLLAAAGKSAQIPLYVWLPDAMEGPTPVSALIHAATMVTAGIYMLARSAALLDLAPETGTIIATIGVITAFWAALIAMSQRDIKRVLAYSTISQLGYMIFAVGLGSYVAAMFHLTTHAFFKALLFLGAGSVIHAMSGEQNMWKMGGLRKIMPITFWTMVTAWLAISGVFPFSGFWSKDEILASAFVEQSWVLWAIGVATAFLTAFYMSRLMFLTFFGEERWPEGTHPHESPAVMTGALVILAVPTVFLGGINTPFALTFEHFLEPAFEFVQLPHPGEAVTLVSLAVMSGLIALAGVGFAYFRYLRRVPQQATGGYWSAAEDGFYIDDIYGRTIVLPGKWFAGWLAVSVDEEGIDRIVNGVGGSVRRLGDAMRPLQDGWVRSYAAGIGFGALGLVILMLFVGGVF